MQNIPLARKVLEFAQNPPENFRHSQMTILEHNVHGYWQNECGTVGCLAGITTMLASENECEDMGWVNLVSNDGVEYRTRSFKVNGEVMSWSNAAAKLLGMTVAEQTVFFNFHEANAIRTFEHYIKLAETIESA